MKYQRDLSFRSDYGKLTDHERSLFRSAVRAMNEASDRDPSVWPPPWPAHLRIKPVRGALGVWEMTWFFAGPDGRATFQFVSIEGEPGIRWRRIGGHAIFRAP